MRRLFAGILNKLIINFFRRDGLSRYLVHFVEDDLNRTLPPTGVILLSDITVDKEVIFINSYIYFNLDFSYL